MVCRRGVVFSGDAFSAFGALDGGITDSQVEPERYWDEMRRYYACIVKPSRAEGAAKGRRARFGPSARRTALSRRREIPCVVDMYDRLSYMKANRRGRAYGSMYGNTEQMAERIARELAEAGVRRIRVHNLSYADPSVVLRDVFRYDTLVVGSPTYNAELSRPSSNCRAASRRAASRSALRLRFFFTWTAWPPCAG